MSAKSDSLRNAGNEKPSFGVLNRPSGASDATGHSGAGTVTLLHQSLTRSLGGSGAHASMQSLHSHHSSWGPRSALLNSESGVHDPEGVPNDQESIVETRSHLDSLEAPTSIEASAASILPTSMLSLHNEDSMIERFEDKKRSIGLGFAPAWAGMMLLSNTLLGGSGMLGIPHAFSVAGYALGSVLIVFFGVCSAWGCHLLSCSARKVGRAPCSFYSVSSVVIPRWTWLVDGAVAIKCFGVACSYLIIVGDLFTTAMSGFGLYHERRAYIVIGWFIGGCLACLKNLSALRFTSTIAIVIVMWTMALIIMEYLRVGEQFNPCPAYGDSPLPCNGEHTKKVGNSVLEIVQGLPVFIFGFTCQQNIFTICNEVSMATSARIDFKVIIPAYVLTGVAFTTTALIGYMTYGDAINTDILKQYHSSIPVNVTKIIFSLLVTFSYPLQIHPSRISWLALWRLARPSGSATKVAEWSDEQRAVEDTRFYVVTTCLIVGSLVVGLTVPSLGTILGVVGATGSTTVSYILPGLVYFATFKKWSVKRFFALVQLCMGCVIMPVCLTVLFIPDPNGGGGGGER